MAKWGEGKLEKTCKVCVKVFLARRDRPGIYCSRKCQQIGRPKRIKEFNYYICKECNKECKRRQGAGGTNEYCSIQCMAKMRGRRMRKENHPKWKGGISERTWESRRLIEKKKKYIKFCEICNSEENLEGHHKKGYKIDINDIQILCSECHSNLHHSLKNFIRKKYDRKMDSENWNEKRSSQEVFTCKRGTENPRIKAKKGGAL